MLTSIAFDRSALLDCVKLSRIVLRIGDTGCGKVPKVGGLKGNYIEAGVTQERGHAARLLR